MTFRARIVSIKQVDATLKLCHYKAWIQQHTIKYPATNKVNINGTT